MKRHSLSQIFVLIIGISVLYLVQFSTPTLYDADGYLHIRMAEFLRDLGPHYNFHWARFSTFNGNFADKDFLYHAVLIPFTFFKDIFFGAKIAAFIFAVLLFLGYFLILRKYINKAALAFFLVFFFFSAHFLEAISSPRPIALVILINLLAIHLAIQKRHILLFLTGVFYALIHVTSPLIICYAFVVELIRCFEKKEFHYRTIIFSLLGILTGFLAHPNLPDNFLIFYLNSILVPIYTIKTGVLELGAEFFPLNTREYMLQYPLIIIGAVSIIYIALSKIPKPRFETKVFLAIAGIFFILSFTCQRYLSHGYLIMLMGFGCYVSDALFPAVKKQISRFTLAMAAIVIIILGLNVFNGARYNCLVAKIINGHYESVGRWMEENVPERELVFHANWSDSQYFIGLNPKDDYFVTLDPVYMYNRNPELYKIYRDVSFGKTEDPYVALRGVFNVKYGYAGKNYFSGLIGQIRKDSRFTILAEDNFGVIFKVM